MNLQIINECAGTKTGLLTADYHSPISFDIIGGIYNDNARITDCSDSSALDVAAEYFFCCAVAVNSITVLKETEHQPTLP